jgi:hypothetical protein
MKLTFRQGTRYVNPSGTTGFGSPWEIYFQHGYVVRNKGGNVAG